MLFPLVSLLLLLPTVALAQSAPSFTWSMQASACPADETASAFRAVTLQHLFYRPHTFSVPGPLQSPDPLVVRCPVTGQGPQRFTTLLVQYKDPDGRGPHSRVVVELVRTSVASTGAVAWSRAVWFDSNRHGAHVTGWQQHAHPMNNALHFFGSDTYTVQISLRRLRPPSGFVSSPRVGAVRLADLPVPPNPPEGTPLP